MMTVEAIQGRAERQARRQRRRERRQERKESRKERRQERREEGRAWWQKLGRAAKKVAPPLVAARAAVLALVSNNAGGIASKMAAAQPERAKRKWVSMGGEWSKLADAIEKGSGKRPTVNALPLLAIAPVLQEIGKGASVAAAKKAGAQAVAEGRSEGAGGLWKVAQVIIEPLLRLLGINRDEVAPSNAPPPMSERDMDAADAADDGPSGAGAGEGSNKGLLIAGAAVVALVVLSQKK